MHMQQRENFTKEEMMLLEDASSQSGDEEEERISKGKTSMTIIHPKDLKMKCSSNIRYNGYKVGVAIIEMRS